MRLELIIMNLEKYEERKGGPKLTITQFYCFYRELPYVPGSRDRSDGGLFQRSFHSEPLPLYIFSGKTKYGLRKKEAFWRTFRQSEVNGEKYYYQQIVLNKAIFKTTFIKAKGSYSSWRGNITHITPALIYRLTWNTTSFYI